MEKSCLFYYMICGEVMHTHKEKDALDLLSQYRDKVCWKVMAPSGIKVI
ncbi:hypothetical protein [Clostridium beijerinckii]|nr:hypothetical protein [Clostridium beijerinckii]